MPDSPTNSPRREEENYAPAQASIGTAEQHGVARELEEEVKFLKQQLNETVEKYGSANEELKASNEKLQAMNEEMRSATEELETSEQELESINEKLVTVNNELESSVEELSRANADLDNLMSATQIGTIFLDRQLRVQRFTPSAQKIFNLVPADMGRPLSDITHKFRYPNLLRDAQQVLDDLNVIESEVRLDDGSWFIARIAPYRSAKDRIGGVVATFIDITRRREAGELIEQNARELALVTDTALVFLARFDRDVRLTFANKAYAERFGLTPRDCVGKRMAEIVGAKAYDFFRPMVEKVLKGELVEFEADIPYAKIGSHFLHCSLAPEFDGEEKVTGFVAATMDISERRRVEEALRESHSRFEAAAVAGEVGTWIWDVEADHLTADERLANIFGLDAERAAAGAPLEEYLRAVHPEDRPRVDQLIARALKTGDDYRAEYRVVGADGAIRWVHARGKAEHDSTGKALRFPGAVVEITGRKQREQQLLESEEKLRLLIDGASDYAMFLLDPGNHIFYWNKGAERVFGWTADEVMGKSGELVFTPEDRAIKREEKELTVAQRDGTAPDTRWHLRKDGSRIWGDGVMHRLDDENGELRGFAKIVRDATEQRQAEEELRRSRDELEKRVRERTVELRDRNKELYQEMERRKMLEREILRITERERARISQDLHDSLCQELTATAFLLKSRAKAIALQNKAAADSLTEAAETVNRNAGEARDLARGLHPFELGSAGLPSALRELCSRTNESTNCRCDVPRSLRLEENVAVNLYRIAQESVMNSVKHANANQIVISLERTNREIVLTVSDDGDGKLRRGRGLGIHMMEYRARAAGGEFEIESARGRGTTITCRVPVRKSDKRRVTRDK